MTSRAGLLVLFLTAAFVRGVPVVIADRLTTDVLRYHKVAEHVLDQSWNPYQAPRLYPYPPFWVWFEAGGGALARATGWSFPILIKIPVVAADLGIVALLQARAGRRGAWAYALNPVSVLVTGFHGQFDSILVFFLLLAVVRRETGRRDSSACALAGSIATKSFPVILVPLFLRGMSPQAAARFALLATLPVGLLLLPYALHDFGALRRELLAYGGVADFGWIGAYRGLLFLASDRLPRSEASHWGAFIPLAKVVFLCAYAALVVAVGRGRLRWSREEGILAAILAFLVFYGALSAQYLVWPVALAALRPDRWLVAYSAVAAAALVAFYSFFHPSVLYADGLSRGTGGAWVLGTLAVLGVSALWLATLVRRGAAPAAADP